MSFDYKNVFTMRLNKKGYAMDGAIAVPLIKCTVVPSVIETKEHLRDLYKWTTTWLRYEAVVSHFKYSFLKGFVNSDRPVMISNKFSDMLDVNTVKCFKALLDGKFPVEKSWGFEPDNIMMRPSSFVRGFGLLSYFDPMISAEENDDMRKFIERQGIEEDSGDGSPFPPAVSAFSRAIPLHYVNEPERGGEITTRVDDLIAKVMSAVSNAGTLEESKTDPGIYLDTESVRRYVRDSFPKRIRDVYSIVRNIKPDRFIIGLADGIGVVERACSILGRKGFFSDGSNQMAGMAESLGHVVVCESVEDTLKRPFPSDSVVVISHVLYSDPLLVYKVKALGFDLVVFEHDTLYPGLSTLLPVNDQGYLRISSYAFWRNIPMALSVESRVPVKYPKWTKFLYRDCHLCFDNMGALRYLHTLLRWGAEFVASYIGEPSLVVDEAMHTIGLANVPVQEGMIFICVDTIRFGSVGLGSIVLSVELRSGVELSSMRLATDPVNTVLESDQPFFVKNTPMILESTSQAIDLIVNEVPYSVFFIDRPVDFLYGYPDRSGAYRVYARLNLKVKMAAPRKRRKSALDKLPTLSSDIVVMSSGKPSEGVRREAFLESRPFFTFKDPRGRLKPKARKTVY